MVKDKDNMLVENNLFIDVLDDLGADKTPPKILIMKSKSNF